jgi:hypothetical protein
MPLSSVIGSSSIMQPGVCTSTTRPASPYDGQVIYETDTDRTLVYNGTGWVFLSTSRANPGGLDFITSSSFTAVSSLPVNNCFSSLYDNYKIIVSFTAVTGDTGLLIRMRASGTDSTASYVSERVGGSGASAFASANATGTDDGYLGFVDTASVASFFCSAEIYSPFLARHTTIMATSGGVPTSGNTVQLIWNGHQVASSYDGFTLHSGGTNLTGIISVYGYAK